jgi:hypothetical protein
MNVDYKPEEIGKFLKDLKGKSSHFLEQDVGALAKKAVGVASRDIGDIAKSLKKAATTDISELASGSTLKYYLEFVKVEDDGGGDMWNFYIFSGDGKSGKYFRLGRTTTKIIVDRKEPELLKLKRKKTRLEALRVQKGNDDSVAAELKRIEETLAGNKIRVKEVKKPDFERLFKSRNPLAEFGLAESAMLNKYLAGIKHVPSVKEPWIELADTDEDGHAVYVLKISEMMNGKLVPVKTYPLSHVRDKGDYRVVYGGHKNGSVALFRLYDSGNRCAINDSLIPPRINSELVKLGV